MAARKVILLGQTGAGKSSIGNKLLDNKHAFKSAAIGSNESETEVVTSSQSHVTTSKGDLRMTVFDTPGLGDTKGRSIKFLDIMMDRIKQEKPHAIIFFMPSDMKFGPEINYALKCFAQCLKPSASSTVGMPDGRVLLVVNKLPSDADFGGDFASGTSDKDKILANCMDSANECLRKGLGLPSKIAEAHTFGVQKYKIDQNVIRAMSDAIRNIPDEPLDVGQFRTFAEVMFEATRLKNDAVSADEYAEITIDRLNKDIKWHEKRMRDCNIAMASTCWIPFAGAAAAIGFVIAIEDSRCKLPGLKQELSRVWDNKTKHLEVAKGNAVAWLNEMEDLKKMMVVQPS